ncbi:MAG TPA: head GIN domain-containing protein [Chitinophagaceae bacterium]|nr:head GIN domain-containing protein [Chitinophagaceae bacterium]
MKLLSKLITAAALLTVSSYTFAQTGTSPIDTAIAQVDNFAAIKIQGSFEVHVTQGDRQSVKLEAPTEILMHVEAETKDGLLTVRNKPDAASWMKTTFRNNPDNWWNHHHVVVRIIVTSLHSISMSGSGHIYCADGINAPDLKVRVSGSGKIEGKITTQQLESNISGSGHIDLSGTAETSEVSITGSGHFSSSNLVTSNSKVHISGSGRAEVNASEKLDASVHGSSRVVYTGHPKSISVSKSGSGSVSGS